MTNPSAPDFGNYIVNSIATGEITQWSLTTAKGQSAGDRYPNDENESSALANQFFGEWGPTPVGRYTKDPRPLMFLQWLILNLDQERPDLPKQINRAEMLHLRDKIARCAGMRDGSQPIATLTTSVKNKVDGGRWGETPKGQPWSLPIRVDWFHDHSVILQCEVPVVERVPTPEEPTNIVVTKAVGLIDLYVAKFCDHRFVGRNAGRCYTIYKCEKCGHTYDIDSSD